MFTRLSFLFIAIIPFFAGCASGRLQMSVEPETAEIRLIDNMGSSRSANGGRVLGKGAVSLQRADFLRKLFVISASGYEPFAMYVPEIGPDEQLKVTLQKEDGRLAQEVAALRSDLEAERKTNALLKEQIVKQGSAKHVVGAQLVQLQKQVGLSMFEDAETTANELFKQAEEVLPSSAFCLRAKLRIQQGRLQDAKADLQKALSVNSADAEAKALLESMK